jgi:hypothetical protein
MVATRDPRDPNISDVEETTKGHQNDKADDVMSDDPNAKNKIKRGVKLNILISLLVLFLVVGLIRRVLPSQYSSTKSATGNSIDGYIPAQIRSNQQKNGALSKSVEKCTSKQLDIIQRQLPSEDCLKYKKKPFLQKCSLTYATRCPETIWLDKYYKRLHNWKQVNQQDDVSFVGIFIGCNKGMDAVSAMRMGSNNPIFDKISWKDMITKKWHYSSK